jgi:hypothetical protein
MATTTTMIGIIAFAKVAVDAVATAARDVQCRIACFLCYPAEMVPLHLINASIFFLSFLSCHVFLSFSCMVSSILVCIFVYNCFCQDSNPHLKDTSTV